MHCQQPDFFKDLAVVFFEMTQLIYNQAVH